MASSKNNKTESGCKVRNNASFINNAQKNSAKTKSNLIQILTVTLPKGGGAMKSNNEKFFVNTPWYGYLLHSVSVSLGNNGAAFNKYFYLKQYGYPYFKQHPEN